MGFWRCMPLVAGILVAMSAVGCSTESNKDSDDVGSVENELRLSGTRYLGKIHDGETRTGYYDNPPRYRSFAFDAKGGDQITVDVKSYEGDAVGFITDSSYNVLALNDDYSSSTLDSKVTYEVPADEPAGSYRIVFRDYDLLDATFTVKLSIRAETKTTCAYDGQLHTYGETFKSTDGCNTCFCGSNGEAICSKNACACDPANEPSRNYIGTPQQCMTIRYTCTSGQVPFQNACGCGCERR